MDHPQAQYWKWSKDKHILNRKNQDESSTGKLGSCDQDLSWEEQAFAEDAAGPLGGCIWPPRSYSCSFCRREFRSAQALGGHMNVHRRDRARLKLSNNNEIHQNHVVQYPCTSFDLPYPTTSNDQGSNSFVYNPNPTSQFHTRVSTPPTNDTTTSFQGNYDPKSHDLSSTSLNLIMYRKRQTLFDKVEEESLGSKRKRTNEEESILIPFFDHQHLPKKLKSSKIELHQLLELSPSSTDDVDLELRLGDPPQVT